MLLLIGTDPHHCCTHFGPSQYVIPHWSPSKVNVKVCVAAFHTHQAVSAKTYQNRFQTSIFKKIPHSEIKFSTKWIIFQLKLVQTWQKWKMRDQLLYFGVLHIIDGIGWISLSLFQMTRPHVVHPIYEIYLHTKQRRTIRTKRLSVEGFPLNQV